MAEAQAPSKPFWTSKTMWANVAGMVSPYIVSLLGIDMPTAEVTVLLLGIVNIVLRVVTKNAVSLT